MHYPSPLNKTTQRNSQYCTKLHNKVHNVLHNRIYRKLEFSVWFGFVKQTNNKSLHPQLSIQAISRDIPLTW